MEIGVGSYSHLPSRLYLCSLSGTWRCGFWSQCSQHQTWCHTQSYVQQRLRRTYCLQVCSSRVGGREVFCRFRALWRCSDASQTSGRRAGSSRRGKLRPALVSSSRLILCGATRAASWKNQRKRFNIYNKLDSSVHMLQPSVRLHQCGSSCESCKLSLWEAHVRKHDASYFTMSHSLLFHFQATQGEFHSSHLRMPTTS